MPARRAPDVVLVADPSAGFILLAVRAVSYVKVERLFAADDAATLRRMWRDFEIPDVHLQDVALPWRSRRVMRDGKPFIENEY